jgi:hypothetical protein
MGDPIAAVRPYWSAEYERRELSCEDHRTKRAPERAGAANDLVERPHEKCPVAYAVDRGPMGGRQFEPPQRQREHPDEQRRVRQLPQGQTPVRGAEPPGGGAQASGERVDRRRGHFANVPSVRAANALVTVTLDSERCGQLPIRVPRGIENACRQD